MKYILYLSLFILCVSAMDKPNTAPKEKRIALLIGNGKYKGKDHKPIDNPMNDVDEMEKLLEARGFEVVKFKNLDKDGMKDAINAFIIKIRRQTKDKKQNVISLFYYAGHGNYIKNEDESYLVPINSEIILPEDFKKEAYAVSDLCLRLQNSENFLNIVMLDACRANFVLQENFSDQTMGHGYPDLFEGVATHSSDKANYNLFVSYATAKEGVAESGDDKADFSPYVLAFKEALKEKGTEDIHSLFPLINKKTIKYSKVNRPKTDQMFNDEFFFVTMGTW